MTPAVTSAHQCTGYRGRIDPRIRALEALVYNIRFFAPGFLPSIEVATGASLGCSFAACICQDQSFESLNNHSVASMALLHTHRIGRCHH